ncbi:spore germination protein [Cohnella zeiphila]|uniref:spore germination protein n=1 Tax=Cohnella zeiphila TaxID=2761120 RepID=UPI00308004FB
MDKSGSAEADATALTDRPSLQKILEHFKDCSDMTRRSFSSCGVEAVYFTFLAGNDELLRDLVLPFADADPQEAASVLYRPPYCTVETLGECIEGILNGHAAIFLEDRAWLADVARSVGRKIEQSETETVIAGPHDGFVENWTENLAVIRRRLKSAKLKTVMLSVGEVSKTKVVLLYLDGIANPALVDRMTRRVESIEIDGVYDANMFVQLIDENPNSVFPQFMTTERPDAVTSKLLGGRIACIVDGSPSVFSTPTSFFDFFASPDDYYQRWLLGTALRMLRILGFLITICFTAFYVAITTFHYEMIPHTMLLNLTESRSKVPFPPLIEALLMETTIELLREAGARLPTKIGQTIGIVGGIVIGQAAVQAGFTSNILIIAVATSAIASFVIPSYIMSASLRLIRFGLIILAGILGNLGLMMGIALVIIQLAGITNLGASYLTPVAPANLADAIDTFVRGPFYALRKRPSIAQSPNPVKVKMKK